MKRTTAIIPASIILMFAFSGCTSNQTGKTANDTITSDLYFAKQEIRRSPDRVTKPDAAKACDSECEAEKALLSFGTASVSTAPIPTDVSACLKIS